MHQRTAGHYVRVNQKCPSGFQTILKYFNIGELLENMDMSGVRYLCFGHVLEKGFWASDIFPDSS